MHNLPPAVERLVRFCDTWAGQTTTSTCAQWSFLCR